MAPKRGVTRPRSAGNLARERAEQAAARASAYIERYFDDAGDPRYLARAERELHDARLERPAGPHPRRR